MTIFSVLEGRLWAILTQARGADGSLGADALARSLPLDRFRAAASNASLRDPAYPREQIDRAIRLEWASVRDDNGNPSNPFNGPQLRVARLTLLVGYVQGADVAVRPFASLAGSETAASVTVNARSRALDDAERIYRALSFIPLLTGAPTLDPVPLSCFRESESVIEDLGDGRLLSSTVYRMRFQSDSGTTYDP